MMAERGIEVNHSTVHRWVIKLLPVLEKAFRRRQRLVGNSWRMDETYILVKGQWKYLYRAVDKAGKTIDFLLRARRDTAAARRSSKRPSPRTVRQRPSRWTRVARTSRPCRRSMLSGKRRSRSGRTSI